MAETLHPSATTTEPTQLHYVSVDRSFDAEQAARDAANDRLTQELNEGGRVKRIIKGVWKGGALKEYYHRKYAQQAREQIEHAGDVLLFQATEEQSARAKTATIERFLHEDESMIHREANEDRAEVAGDSELAKEMKKLIRQNVEGTLSDAAMLEERTRLLDAYHEAKGGSAIGAGRMRIDNMLDITAAVKGAIDHGESLDSVIANMKISMGESRSGVRSEVKYNWVEKMADKMSKSKVGSLIGPEVVASATTIAASVLRFGSHSVVGALTKTVLPGAAAGLWSGLRENKRMKDDRVQHSRDMAMGKEIVDGSDRREKMEQTRYATASATELISTLGQHFNDEKPLDTKDAYETALAALGAVEARIRLSDSQNIDLISYSNAGAVEEERLLLDIARAQAKVAAEARLDPEMRKLLGVNDTVTLQNLITERSEAFLASVEEDRTQKDRLFAKMKRRAVAGAAVDGAMKGMIFGALFQEGLAAVSDTRVGLVEQAWNAEDKPFEGTMHQTLAHGLFNGEHGPGHVGPSETYVDHRVGTNGNFNLSSDQALVKNPDGTLTIENAKGDPIIEGLTTDENGALSKESIAQMRAAGLTVEDMSHREDLPPLTEERDGTLDDYLDRHSDETVTITRTGWEDNGTPDIFEGDELGLHLGGENGTGIQADGSYQFNVSTMSADTWKSEAEAGNIKLAISASVDSQTEVFMVDVNPDGTVNIPKDSPVAAFMKEEGGEAKFIGKYAEIVHVDGVNEDGATEVRPVATLIGEDTARGENFPVSEEVPRQQLVPEYKITSPGYDTPPDFTEMAPIIPISSRKSLEVVRRIERPGYYYGYDSSPERVRAFRKKECSPRLNRNPETRLKPKQELDWHRDQLKKLGGEYLRGIDDAIASSPELKNLRPETKAIVTIPVAAASESGNIYKTLASYAGQSTELDRTTVLLHVNWFDSMEADPAKADSIKKTWEEIERARKDFPQLSIATIKSVWEEEKKKRGEYGEGIIGHVARKMYDTAMMSVQKAMAEGNMATDREVLLIRNDADAQGIRKTYLGNMIKTFDAHPENDVFTGAIRWGTERHSDLPGFAFVSNFREVMHIAAHRKGVKVWPPTVGINTAVRMSTFAAVNGIGYDPVRTGIGTDDYNIGGRIKDARQVDPTTARTLRNFWRLRSNSGKEPRRGRVTGGYGYSSGGEAEKYGYHRHVAGADIDTAPDRLEKAYVSGVPITRAWDNWGNELRDEGLRKGVVEDLKKNPGEIIARVETDMSAAFTERYHDRAHVRAGLSAVLPTSIKGKPAYHITRTPKGTVFKFTPEGEAWFLNRLQRDGKGRYDPIGRRVRRKLYHETTGSKTPNTSSPLMA